MAKEGILLESGTNEVEILEFVLNSQSFGVNVLKIQAIEQYDPSRVTQIQLSHPSIVGTLLFRDSCITLVDLRAEMDTPVSIEEAGGTAAAVIGAESADSDNRLVLVMEFNNRKTAFLVDGVNRIHRVSWESISPLSAFLNTPDSKFTGSLEIEDREILIVDLEKIVAEILPGDQLRNAVAADADHPLFAGRAAKTVFFAEDSAVVRETVETELGRGNYGNIRAFANGKECFDAISALRTESGGASLAGRIDVLITDIEMPAMDGLALCRALKSDPATREIPVIIFSSLINEQIARKCEEVGADAYITKPQFKELVNLLDAHTAAPEPALA
ncbi:chemotaxis protein CheV [bacterium]|nr:chemotaxis protein CheV [bacterium]